jgi:probable addiction module antidote protein
LRDSGDVRTDDNRGPAAPHDIARVLNESLERDPAVFVSALMTIMKAHGMSAMARASHVSRYTLYRYERGSDRPLFETVVRMTAACGLKLMVVPDDEGHGGQ